MFCLDKKKKENNLKQSPGVINDTHLCGVPQVPFRRVKDSGSLDYGTALPSSERRFHSFYLTFPSGSDCGYDSRAHNVRPPECLHFRPNFPRVPFLMARHNSFGI
ncbi:hypothetical protein CEXT_187361 [Caerostris extrusa]|uniref:Uncharacterized protein n=1 Tax=Caerostris extrusa TaxID=172846 RepID=A0AAV4VTL4_CAEEX|nr:hypothetical protein CEXT_187361 [Caerostris extrusa]